MMYNYARTYTAAFSKSYKKACDLSEPATGGRGECFGNYGPRSATGGRCPHSARDAKSGNPPRGDARARTRNAGQPMTGARRVSPSEYRQVDSAKDEWNIKPPLQGPQVRRLFPLRRKLQRNKVRPLNIDGPSLTSEARPPCPNARRAAARYAMFIASSQISYTTQGSGNLVVVGQSCKLTNINSDRTSLCPPVDDNDRPSSVVPVQARVLPKPRPKRPWTSRIRSLFAPWNRGATTTIQPFIIPIGQSEGQVSRPTPLKEDHSDPGHQSRYTINALTMNNQEAKGFRGNVSTGTMYRRLCATTMATRPVSDQYFSIPGVPQFDWDNLQSSLPSPPRNDTPILSQGEDEVTSLIVNYDDGSLLALSSTGASFCNSSVSVMPSFQSQRQAMEDGKTSDKEVDIPNPYPLTSISRGDEKSFEVNSTPQPTPVQDREDEDKTIDDTEISKSALQSPSTKGPISASSDFRSCSSCLEVQERVKEDQDGAHNDVECILKHVAPCSTATNEEFTTTIIICHLDKLQAEVVEDGDTASYPKGANSKPERTPSLNDALSLPRTPTFSVTSSDEEKTTPGERETCTFNKVLFSVLPGLPSAISKKEAFEKNGDKTPDDKGSHEEQASTSSSTRSGLSNAVQSHIMPSLSENPESAVKQGRAMVSENEGSTSEPIPSMEKDITSLATSFLATPQHHNEMGEGGDVGGNLKLVSKPVSPSNLTVSTTSPSSSSSQRLGSGTMDGDVMYGDGDDDRKSSSMRAVGSVNEKIKSNVANAKELIFQLSQITSLSTEGEASVIESVQAVSPGYPANKPSDNKEGSRTSSTTSQALEYASSCRQVAFSKDSEPSSSTMARKDSTKLWTEQKAKESDSSSSTAAAVHLKDISNNRSAASSRVTESSSPMVDDKSVSEQNFEKTAEKEDESDSDRREPTPARNQSSSIIKYSMTSPTSGSPKEMVNKASSYENHHSLKSNILNKSSSKDASTAMSPSKNAHATQGTRNGLPKLTAYPSIDPSELEFVLSDRGGRVLLGSGNFGEVLLMRRQGDPTLLAVKVLTRSFSLIQQEVAAMHAVMNFPYFPRFVAVIDYCSYAQELVGGVGRNTAYNFSMARYDYHLLNALEWLHVCYDVTEGLKALHASGWLHNDLHCGNAMVCPNQPGAEVAWCGKIIDLGNAQQISNPGPLVALDNEQQNEFYKVAKQCAPEVLEGRGTFTEKSDIYSLGKLFVDVAGDANILNGLRLLGEFSCMRRSPGARPSLETISGKLDDFIVKMVKAAGQQPSSPTFPSSSSTFHLRHHLS